MSKKKETQKKKGRGESLDVASSIVSTSRVAATPVAMHSGPPSQLLESMGASAGLTSSALFVLPKEELQTDETDTSLYDYQNARDTFAYSSLHYGEAGGDRLNLVTPPPPPQFDDGYHRVVADIDDEDSDPLYAKPNRLQKKRSKSPGSTKGSSLRRYEQDDLRATGHSSTQNSVRFSDTLESESRNTTWQGDQTVHSVMSESNMSGHNKTASRTFVASPRLATLERQQVELLKQQDKQRQQLGKQKQLHQSVSVRLKMMASDALQQSTPDINEMGSLLHESLNVTDNTLRQQEDLVKSFEARMFVLQQENAELCQLNGQLQAEVNSVQRVTSFTDVDSSGGSESVLKKQLQDYRNERDTLRALTLKLNAELSRYQAKFRPLNPAEMEALPGLPLKGRKPSWLMNTKYLAPLLVAYDDQLRDNERIITGYQDELSGLRQSVEDVVKENERLHLRIEQTDISGPTSMTEWRQLQEQCKLVLEENQLLMEQLDVNQKKTCDMHAGHVTAVAKWTQQLAASNADRKESECEVDELRRRCDQMKHQLESAVVDNKCKVALDEHMMTVSQLKRSQEDDHVKHERDISELTTNVKTLMTEKKALILTVEQLQAEKKLVQLEEKSVRKVIRKAQRQIVTLEKAVEQAKCSEYTVDHYLTKVLSAANESQVEMEAYVSAVLKQAQNSKVTLSGVMGDKAQLIKMVHQFKVYKEKLSENLDKALRRIKEQDEEMNRHKKEYERQLKHLRLLNKEKDDLLELLTGEKNQVEFDLETMWQAASADNRRMKQSVKHTIERLKKHPHLHDLLSDEEGRDDSDV